MNIQNCPKYISCSAQLCPLDPKIFRRVYLKDEAVCFYIREFVKDGAMERFRQRGGTAEEIYISISHVLPELLSRYAPLQRALKRAVATGSKWKSPVGQKAIRDEVA